MIFNLSSQNTIANQFISELRDKDIQLDRGKFRKNMKRLGQLMAYEISKKLDFKEQLVQGPLAASNIPLLAQHPVLLTVLRAGLPYLDGFLDYFDRSDCGFIGAYREEGSDEILIHLDYVAVPVVNERIVILVDPMLATGKSIIRSVETLLKRGQPSHIFIAALVAAPEGIHYIKENLNVPFSIYTCAIDENLNDQFYIVPGLGDAGDLSFGLKM
ncbi:uracil phosphoribosyltransferase [Chryseolinea sp. H1M3-3]|uniref:uracil phosphoribosyltransferase n=1 Tax=Chryseolinea sp. H1M3-3 TaxID=3034144 RepID=UPI0023EBD891|nr:uracil phosphoribosyltransferase [Chryseolinea sp. H1M3-3]